MGPLERSAPGACLLATDGVGLAGLAAGCARNRRVIIYLNVRSEITAYPMKHGRRRGIGSRGPYAYADWDLV